MPKTEAPIQPSRVYSATELYRLGIFGVKDIRTVQKIIMEDKLAKKPILKPAIHGSGNIRRYYILGKNVLAYVNRKP